VPDSAEQSKKDDLKVKHMSSDRPTRLRFGPFRYDAVRRELSDAAGTVRIGARALQLLELLLERPGSVCSRDDLVRRLWPTREVEESGLRVHMAALRRTLGDGQDDAKYIVTVPGRGYAFVADVVAERPDVAADPVAPGAAEVPSAVRARACPIGRGPDIARIGELLEQQRLVSIVAAGGMGKTTVALAVAENKRARYPNCVFFVDLSSLSEATLVVVEVAQRCGVGISRSDPWPALLNALQRQHALIVLDNCEHVIDAAASLADRILARCPQVRILTTSREPLEAESEVVVRLAPLGLPSHGSGLQLEHALSYPAIQLFVERAEAASAAFELTDGNVAAVHQLCEFLDGMPLALELAAARVGSLGVQGLHFHLASALELLTRGRRTAMGRHRTLHAVLNWSYELLTDTEKLVLQRLAVFRSAFDLDAAVAVAASHELAIQQVREDVRSLQDKSLVAAEPNDSGPPLYRLLYVTRLFAERTWALAADEAALKRRHAELVLQRMVEANHAKAQTRVKSLNSTRASRFSSATAELRSALTWTLLDENDLLLGIEITAEALHVYHSASLLDEYLKFMNAAIDKVTRAGASDTRLEFRLYQRLAFISGQAITTPEERARCARKTRVLGQRFGTDIERIEALYAVCTGAYGHGDYLLALSCCEEIRELTQGEHERLRVPVADRLSVLSLHALGQHDAAERLAHRVMQFDTSTLELRFQSDVPFGVSMRIQLARIHWLRGDFQLAWATLLETISQDDAAHIFVKCQPLGMAAIPMSIWKGDMATAARWCRELLDHSTRTSIPYWQAFAKVYERLIQGEPLQPGSVEVQLLEQSPMLDDIVATVLPGAPRPTVLKRVHDGQVGWCAPEVLRLAALAKLDASADGRARCIEELKRAMDLSVEQGARFWSLRLAMSLFAVSTTESAERASARDLLRSLLNTIDDGSQLRDLREARQMVESHDTADRGEALPTALLDGQPKD
jgi:predicted ATPase/DNA-binding winged helix-turn-helix (wHTH) protein